MTSEKIDALELDITAKLTSDNLDKLIDALNKLSKAIDKVNAKKLNTEVKETGDNAKTASVKVDGLTNSFLNQTIRITALIAAYKKLSGYISDSVADSMTYIKTLNMFNVSLGDYADNASKYGNTVREAMGIDIAGWQKAQGIFETLIEGFGVGGDQAAYMSQQLTQLSYDIASYYDLTTEEAQNKVKAALSGRIEPIRKLGWDISQGKLVDIASNPENYGITTYSINEQTGAIEANTQAVDDNTEHKIVNFNQLTQQEKVQLRYIALMTQVTEVQGNMGKTLHDPANQMKIFKEQTAMTARALGNIFIPAINEVLPYLTAFARLLEETFQDIANFFGFEIPDMSDRIGVEDEVDYYDDIVEATGSAAKNAKKIKDYMIGIDELNVLRPDDTGTGGGGSSGGEQSNLNNLLIPGYDFLSTAIENRVKEAKEQLDGLIQDFKENPLQVSWEIVSGGVEEVSKGIWSVILGKTPEELAQEAYDNGTSVWHEFAVTALYDSAFSKVGDSIWRVLLGKTPDEMGEDAYDNGTTVGEEFLKGVLFSNNAATFLVTGGIGNILAILVGEDSDLAKRAGDAGKTVGQQFSLEFSKMFLSIFASNPIFKEMYKIVTGRDADKDLEQANFLLNATKSKKVYTKTAKSDPLGNTSADEARKRGEEAAKNYAEGWENSQYDLAKTGNDIYNTIWKGVTKNGNANSIFKNASTSQARSYNEGLLSEKTSTNAAGHELFESSYRGVTNNGYAGIYYYNAAMSGVNEYISGLLGNKNVVSSTGDDLAQLFTNSLGSQGNKNRAYNSGYALSSEGANGTNAKRGDYTNVANNLANLFANALGSSTSKRNAYNSGYNMANEGTWGAYDLQDDFVWTGEMAGQGYIGGIGEYRDLAERMGGLVAKSTLYRLQEVLGIASPSKVMAEQGMFTVLGYANGIEDYIDVAVNAVNDMARASIKAADFDIMGGVSIPSRSNAGYGIGAMNEGVMASLASNIYQAIVSGMSAYGSSNGGDIKVIIDGKEVFKAVQSEGRKRGAEISNGAFSR